MDREITVGTYVKPENWPIGENLEPGLDGFCDFYLPTGHRKPLPEVIAVNVKVTGRTPQRFAGDLWLRVKITFVGDGEPDTYTGGWVLAYPTENERRLAKLYVERRGL